VRGREASKQWLDAADDPERRSTCRVRTACRYSRRLRPHLNENRFHSSAAAPKGGEARSVDARRAVVRPAKPRTRARPAPSGIREARRIKAANILDGLGLLPLVFPTSFYLDLTGPLVPRWLPQPVFGTYLTGAIYLATGLAIVAGIGARLTTAIVARRPVSELLHGASDSDATAWRPSKCARPRCEAVGMAMPRFLMTAL
jgi:hypothetical protein